MYNKGIMTNNDNKLNNGNQLSQEYTYKQLSLVRALNKLVYSEDNNDRLLEKACRVIRETYNCNWVCFIPNAAEKNWLSFFEAGMERDIKDTLLKQTKKSDKLKYLKEKNNTVCAPVSYNEKSYGQCAVNANNPDIKDKNWAIIQNTAGDLAFVVYMLELKLQKQAAVSKAEKEAQKFEDMEFLSNTAQYFINLSEEQNIYRYIGEKIRTLVPDGYIIVSSFNHDKKEMKIEHLEASDGLIQKSNSILGWKIKEKHYPVNEPQIQAMMQQKLTVGPRNIYDLAGKQISKITADLIEKLFGISNLYALGLVSGERLIGSVIILTKKGSIKAYRTTLEAFIKQASIALQNRLTQEKLRNSEQMFRLAQENAHLGSWEISIIEEDVKWSDEFFRICGYKPQEFIPNMKNCFSIMHPEDRADAVKQIDKAVKTGAAYNWIKRVLRPSGEVRWVSSQGIILNNDKGVPSKVVGSLLDITERKQAEIQLQEELSERESLLQEVHHRVKNNLNVIASLLNLQAKEIDSKTDAEKALEESRDRVYAIAKVHETLYQSDKFAQVDMKHYAEKMIEDLSRMYGFDLSPKLKKDIDNVLLTMTKAVPCGMIINELLSNVCKHAFKNGEKGKVYILLKNQNQDMVQLIIADKGKGLPDNFDIDNTKTLGFKLIKMLTRQIDGKVIINGSYGNLTDNLTGHYNTVIGIEFPLG